MSEQRGFTPSSPVTGHPLALSSATITADGARDPLQDELTGRRLDVAPDRPVQSLDEAIRRTPVNPEMTVQKNDGSAAYEATVDGRVVGMIVYHTPRGDHRVTLSHTIVDPEYRGKGIATRLVKHALDDLRARGLTLTNYCVFVADYIADHPEYRALVDSRFPGGAKVPDRAPRERADVAEQG